MHDSAHLRPRAGADAQLIICHHLLLLLRLLLLMLATAGRRLLPAAAAAGRLRLRRRACDGDGPGCQVYARHPALEHLQIGVAQGGCILLLN